MKYLFYDFECANCLNKNAKISSFGYILTDEDFNIIKSENLFINPEANFYYNDKDTKELVKVEPNNLKEILDSPKYDERYNQIKELLTDENTICIGFGNDSDAYSILDSNKRYFRRKFDYSFIDLKDLFKYVYKDNKVVKSHKRTSLAFVTKFLNIKFDQKHNSLDDSFAAMEIFKKIVKKSSMPILDLAKEANALFRVKNAKVSQMVNGNWQKHERTIYPDMNEPEEDGYIEPKYRCGSHLISPFNDIEKDDIDFLTNKLEDYLNVYKGSTNVEIYISDSKLENFLISKISFKTIDDILNEIISMYDEVTFEPFTLSFDFDYVDDDSNNDAPQLTQSFDYRFDDSEHDDSEYDDSGYDDIGRVKKNTKLIN